MALRWQLLLVSESAEDSGRSDGLHFPSKRTVSRLVLISVCRLQHAIAAGDAFVLLHQSGSAAVADNPFKVAGDWISRHAHGCTQQGQLSRFQHADFMNNAVCGCGFRWRRDSSRAVAVGFLAAGVFVLAIGDFYEGGEF